MMSVSLPNVVCLKVYSPDTLARFGSKFWVYIDNPEFVRAIFGIMKSTLYSRLASKDPDKTYLLTFIQTFQFVRLVQKICHGAVIK